MHQIIPLNLVRQRWDKADRTVLSTAQVTCEAASCFPNTLPQPLLPLRILAQMDWQGQKLAEQLMQILLLAFAVVAFATGYILGSFQMMVLIYAGGVVLTTLVTVPNWPFFNRHPLKWLDPSEAEKHPKPQKAVNLKKKPTKKIIIKSWGSVIFLVILWAVQIRRFFLFGN